MRYIVFERPKGLKCWTMAYKTAKHGGDIPAQFRTKEQAQDFIATVTASKTAWIEAWQMFVPVESHIASVKLPK
jgi:hypothetical protein